MRTPPFDRPARQGFLRCAHGNATLLPSEQVEFDFLTDSLQHQAGDWSRTRPNGVAQGVHAAADLEELLAALFGFPFNIPLGQGRQAEALLARLCARPGTYIPTNFAFPTTRLHQELQGAHSCEALTPEAYEPENRFPFKGNLDLEKLRALVESHTPKQISYVAVELCANGVGGQPISMANLREVRKLTQQHGIPLFLDATRILENAFQIKTLEADYHTRPVWEIVREICAQADGMTMSLTKDFPTPIGGLVAFRNEALYQHGLDFAMAMGDGLSVSAKAGIARALRYAQHETGYIEERMALVRTLHSALLAQSIPVVQPAGGHAVIVRLDALLEHLPAGAHSAHALNHAWYEGIGLRGSPHQGPAQAGAPALFRLAIPILKYSAAHLEEVLRRLKRWQPKRTAGLRQVYAPSVPGGAFRAWFAPSSSSIPFQGTGSHTTSASASVLEHADAVTSACCVVQDANS